MKLLRSNDLEVVELLLLLPREEIDGRVGLREKNGAVVVSCYYSYVPLS